MIQLITMVLFLILILLQIIPGAYALNAAADKPLSDIHEEGDIVEFILTVSDYPPGNYSMRIETRLDRNGEQPIYEFLGFNEIYNMGDRYKKIVQISSLPPNNVRVRINGKIPSVTSDDNCGEVNIVLFESGPFEYYEVAIVDSVGQQIGLTEEEYFLVKDTDQEEFQKKLDKLTTSEYLDLRGFADQLYNKGLVDDANKLVDLVLEQSTSKSVKTTKNNYLVYIGALVLMIICGFIAYRMGSASGYDEGYTEGYNEGYEEGYDEGCKDTMKVPKSDASTDKLRH